MITLNKKRITEEILITFSGYYNIIKPKENSNKKTVASIIACKQSQFSLGYYLMILFRERKQNKSLIGWH